MRDGGSRSQRSESRGAKRSALTAKQRRPVSDLIEGRRAVAEALDAGIPLKSAFVQDSLADSDSALSSLVRRLDGEGVPVETVPRSRLDQLSSHGAHQGIVVRTRPFEYASVEDVIAAAGEGDALVVVLDHVTDEGNFGAIVRSAEVVGAAGVVIANTRAATVGVGAYKTSAGAVLHIPIAQVPNLPRAIDQLKEAGFWACAATEHAEQDVWSAPLGGRLALVMGSEGEGISRLVLDHCDFGARLPQRGRVESLNVAQAATVMCYEWLRRVSQKGEGAELDG
jgi:23S rRNA (guanosine2251-2'-O)-methyltransferase